jgi:hypothetical protein
MTTLLPDYSTTTSTHNFAELRTIVVDGMSDVRGADVRGSDVIGSIDANQSGTTRLFSLYACYNRVRTERRGPAMFGVLCLD